MTRSTVAAQQLAPYQAQAALQLLTLAPPTHPAGMIMWPTAKRAVSDQTAAAIAAAAKQHGAEPVGVFVDEDAATITQRCRAAGIPVAQLHGDASRASLNDIPADLQVRMWCSFHVCVAGGCGRDSSNSAPAEAPRQQLHQEQSHALLCRPGPAQPRYVPRLYIIAPCGAVNDVRVGTCHRLCWFSIQAPE